MLRTSACAAQSSGADAGKRKKGKKIVSIDMCCAPQLRGSGRCGGVGVATHRNARCNANCRAHCNAHCNTLQYSAMHHSVCGADRGGAGEIATHCRAPCNALCNTHCNTLLFTPQCICISACAALVVAVGVAVCVAKCVAVFFVVCFTVCCNSSSTGIARIQGVRCGA